jgi:hypothetical protein
MATTEALTENSRQGINFQIPPCIGLDARLSPNLRPGCGHAYDETPVGLVVYVRNDPVNLVDPDGRAPLRINGGTVTVIGSRSTIDWILDDVFPWELNLREAEWDPNVGKGRNVGQSIISASRIWKEGRDKAIDKALAGLEGMTEKEDCAQFLASIFSHAKTNLQGKYGTQYASASAIISLAKNAEYHIYTKGDMSVTPDGRKLSEALAIPESGTYTVAFVVPGFNVVYLGQNAFAGNMKTLLLHEALHLIFKAPDGNVLGFGLSDLDLAASAGVDTKGMTNDQASIAFTEKINKSCR